MNSSSEALAKQLSNSKLRIALINPMGDFGISTYTHELAEALVEDGAQVDVYASDRFNPEIAAFPRKHRLYPILNSFIFRKRMREANTDSMTSSVSAPSALARPRSTPKLLAVRKFLMSAELAWHLRKRRYDLIWTQWPDMESYGTAFWRLSRLCGMRMVHTVHNVLPHEESSAGRQVCETVYRKSERLIVHSNFAAKQLDAEFPGLERKTIISRHGLFTVFPRRPEARTQVRQQLGISEDDIALLCCGAIRPYKNFNNVIKALRDPRCSKPIVIVAGKEPGDAADPLAHTRELVERSGLTDRVRLLAKFLSFTEMAELFEASDVVMLPYAKGYGSGLLLQAMRFEKYVVSSRTGGAEEYLEKYPRAVLLDGVDVGSIGAGIAAAQREIATSRSSGPLQPVPELEWRNIARDLLEQLFQPTRV